MPREPPVTNTNLSLDGEVKDWTKQQEVTKRRRGTRRSLGRCNMVDKTEETIDDFDRDRQGYRLG
jgi:hypothetical protein